MLSVQMPFSPDYFETKIYNVVTTSVVQKIVNFDPTRFYVRIGSVGVVVAVNPIYNIGGNAGIKVGIAGSTTTELEFIWQNQLTLCNQEIWTNGWNVGTTFNVIEITYKPIGKGVSAHVTRKPESLASKIQRLNQSFWGSDK